MRRQAINFAPASVTRSLDQTPLAARVVLVVGIVLCLVAAWSAERSLGRLHAVDEEIRQTAQELDARSRQKRAPIDSGVTEEQAASVNAAIRQLNLPWRDVLDAVEAGTPVSVELLSLEPDSKRSVVKIEAESPGDSAMLDYVEQLKLQPFLTGVFLTKHATDETDGHRPLRFQLEAAWRSVQP
jgi:hypothetical protein